MPSTKGLELMVRRTRLTDEEWFELIEARRSLIKPHLDSFTLGELWRVACLKSGEHYHEIALDSPTVTTADGRFSLKTQGMFYSAGIRYGTNHSWIEWYQKREVLPKGVAYVWGLTRSGLWILAEINFEGQTGYKDEGYEQAKTVKISKTDPRQIAAVTGTKPKTIWLHLGGRVKYWTLAREVLWQNAREIALRVEMEELLVSLTSKSNPGE